jgi:hypothetical protein
MQDTVDQAHGAVPRTLAIFLRMPPERAVTRSANPAPRARAVAMAKHTVR